MQLVRRKSSCLLLLLLFFGSRSSSSSVILLNPFSVLDLDLSQDFRTRGVELACAEILENLSEEFVDEIIRLRQEYAEKTAEMNIPQRRKEDQKFLYRLFENICVHTLQGTENCNWSQAMAEKIAVSPEISARRHKYARIPAQDSSRIEAEQEEDAATVAKRQRKAELLRKSKQTEAQTARVLVGPKHPKGSGTVDVKVRKIDL